MAPVLNVVVTATNQTQQGFAGVQAGLANITVATQQATQATQTQTAAQSQNAVSARTLASLQQQLARTNQQIELASTDAAGGVRILTANYERLSTAARQAGLSVEQQARANLAASQAQLQLIRATNAQNRTGLTGTLRQLGTGALLQAGVATGGAVLGQQLIQLGEQSADLAVRAETIGTAYEGATRRARVGADDLLRALKDASRGTVSETELMASANKALALGVGQDAGQIGDLLAIARQKGKDFGESTQQAFEDITIGLGRLSPRILDNLGIILDENQIYQDYAKSIGVVNGQLTDQQKRQALVNDLLRENKGLITQNAQAALDAADQAAQATARQEAAEARLGKALIPVKIAYQETFATILEGLTGITRETDKAAQEKLLAGSSSFEDYQEQSRKRTQEMYASGNIIGARQNAMDMAWRSEYDDARARASRNVADANDRAYQAEERAYLAQRATPVTTVPSSQAMRFGGFGISREERETAFVRASGAPQVIVNIYPQGLVHSERDLADYMRDAAKDDGLRNAIEVMGGR